MPGKLQKTIASIFYLVLLGGYLLRAFSEANLWPFISFDMFARGKPVQGQFFRLYGVKKGAREEVRIENSLAWPLTEYCAEPIMNLHRGAQRERLVKVIWKSRRKRFDEAGIQELRLYSVEKNLLLLLEEKPTEIRRDLVVSIHANSF